MTKLPNGWEVKKFEDIFDIERGGSPRPIKEYLTDDKNGINWIKISDINNQKYIYETKEKIIEEGLKKSKLVVEGDFLISNSMSFGKPVIVKMSKGAIHDGWLLLREKITLCKDYFYYLFCSGFMYSLLFSKATGSTVKNLNINMVKELEVPLPSLEEQRKIVKILDEKFASIYESIRLAKDDLLSLDELWQSILNNSFNPLKSKLDNDTYTLPPTWKWEKLGDICEKISAGGDKPEDFTEFKTEENTVPVYANGVKNNGLVGYTKESVINVPSLTISARGTIGFVSIRREPYFPIVRLISAIPNCNFLQLDFLYFALQFFIASGEGSSIPQLTIPKLKQIQIPLPPLKEQERIAKELESKAKTIKELKELYAKRLKDYEELKESLLDLAFKGGL